MTIDVQVSDVALGNIYSEVRMFHGATVGASAAENTHQCQLCYILFVKYLYQLRSENVS